MEEVAQVKAGFFQENVLTEGDTTQQQLLAKGMEDSEPAIWITSPKNDTTVFTMIGGVVVVAFETRGFPSGEIPIEVSIVDARETRHTNVLCIVSIGFMAIFVYRTAIAGTQR